MPPTTPVVPAPHGAPAPLLVADPWLLACQVADVLAGMTYEERVRSYSNQVFTPHELAVAAAWLPQEMPLLDGEYEWIAFDAE